MHKNKKMTKLNNKSIGNLYHADPMYGVLTWSLSHTQNKLRTTQGVIERNILNIKRSDKIPYKEIR